MQNQAPHTAPWFNASSLFPLTDPGTWARGLQLYRSQKVLQLDIEPSGDHWQLLGDVQGSQRTPYEVSIDMALLPDGQVDFWDSHCSCPVGRQCKHGLALMLKAAYQGLHLLGHEAATTSTRSPPSPEKIEAARQAAQERVEEQSRQQADAQLLGWLRELDRAANNSATDTAPEQPGQPKPEQYVYLLSILGSQGQTPQLNLEARLARPRLSGGWTKPKPIRSQPHLGQALFDAASDADREVLQLLQAMPQHDRHYSAYSASPSAAPSGQAGLIALQQAASTGRLFLDDGHGYPGQAIKWGAPQNLNWHWQEVAGPQAGPPGWALRARLASADARLCLNNPPLYLDSAQGRCGQVQAAGIPQAQLAVLLKAPPLKEAALQKHQLELIRQLGPLPLPPMLQSLSRLDNVRPAAHLHLSLSSPQEAGHRGLIQAQLRFDYQGHRGWWAGQGLSVLIEGAAGRVLLQRDAEAELDAITRLMDLGLVANDGGVFGLSGEGPQQDWLHWADTDFSVLRDAGFVLTLDQGLSGWISRAETLDVQLRSSGEDEASSPWFELSLGMEINGQRHNILPWLPNLIGAAAAGPQDDASGQPTLPPFIFLPAPGGQGFIRLPTEALKPWMAALLELVGERGHDFSADSLKLSRLDALRASAALGEGAVWEGAAALRATVQPLVGQQPIPEVPAPAGLQASLRPYQQQGLNWLQFLRQHGLGGILADDMGLGKTLQTLAHVLAEKEAGRLSQPALIIAPVSLMGNWRREAERFTPGLRTLVLHGKERHDAASDMAGHDLVIAPYSLLQRDRERWLAQPWHLVVLDEAQNIKNTSTHAAQVVGQLQTRHRLCLSGTPMENHLGELWSLFHFLMPGFLGSQARFRELFRTPIEKQGDIERLEQLRRRVTPFMLRRTKREVATELPDKIETISSIELSGKQADLYETIRLATEKAVRDALASKGLAKSQIQILDALLKLRQVCCDPRLLALDSAKKIKSSAKLEQLMELLPEMIAEGRRVLLFSSFTSMLSLIEYELKARKIPWVKLTGQSQKRDAIVERFTSGEVPLFLISLKAGGVGLNLPQADTVIHYDPWWNPATENQATDRAHRIGQKNQVFVYKLVAQGTIEERILALQERKAALADSMYSGAQARKQPLFSESDVAELLKPLG
ncbi:Helicase conserved C-terminal domain-containing protein [Polaromonas sp. OV174]|uniref:DEAD/DEAH box helicase n=1 Tax=Polaromonas sp. OV174 TaxID=1855300 RepID=UPI0008F0B4CC|nr:DEAD/DEAH box helicase [Polaromonas sp. OV174]SFC08449.1 Helicase conserved C-terminal domain-containing protein [Polaromonas sp. OV174]